MKTNIHPIRASLAVGAWGATIYFLIVGVSVPDAWWAVVAMISTFYFTGQD